MNYEFFTFINSLAGYSSWLDCLMIFLSKAGPYILSLLLAGLFGLALLSKQPQLQKNLFSSGIYVIICMLVNYILSLLFPEQRPFVAHSVNLLIPHVANNSFPSNHATGSLSVALAIGYNSHRLSKFTLWLAGGVCFSRIYVGDHYPGDVLGGIVIALLVFSLFNLYLREYINNFYMNITKEITFTHK